MAGRLANKVALITGAGSGIGRAMALRFAAEGAHIIAADVSGAEREVAAQAGNDSIAYRCDVGQPDQLAGLIEQCHRQFGRLDVVCNNAGIGGPSRCRIHELAIEDWDRVIQINLRGAFLVLHYALPLMIRSGGGSIVQTASLGGFLATRGSPAYIASKGAMVMLTKSAALEYVQDNIRINAVCPGVVNTPLVESAPLELQQLLAAQIPMGRLCTPEEVAALALFLASDEASHITGAAYIIDGGRSAG